MLITELGYFSTQDFVSVWTKLLAHDIFKATTSQQQSVLTMFLRNNRATQSVRLQERFNPRKHLSHHLSDWSHMSIEGRL